MSAALGAVPRTGLSPSESADLPWDESDDFDRSLPPEPFEPDGEDRPSDFRLSAIPPPTIPPGHGPRAGSPGTRGGSFRSQLAKVRSGITELTAERLEREASDGRLRKRRFGGDRLGRRPPR